MKKYELELKNLQEKQAKELQELELKHKILSGLESKALPIPDNVYIPCGDIWLTYEADNIQQALNIVKSFDLIKYGIYSNGTTSIKPLTQFSDNELEKIYLEFMQPYLGLEKYDFKRETDTTLTFWADISGYIVKIKIEIKEGINLDVSIIRDKRGRKIKTEVSCLVRNYNHRLQFYKPGEGSADFRLFFHSLEQIAEVFENGHRSF